ncbi:uncharacterized protein GIQ15_03558 [Arthroderma uncinatum]|uniref:uncharacterized protein n=1 Tax=Arthroderma uncinatum TaxID=74035 RepID=UPI00144A7C44|nr:uncharacterized protein GIQ15_03558 [Arthroderma uncinatum]KAF3484234.1 hypothetical protein GIQ15_03558 [Arthroderma uncinatum]
MAPGLDIGSDTVNDGHADGPGHSYHSRPSSLSRGASQSMGPPPLPHSVSPSSGSVQVDNTGVGSGPELEKEQEAAVNRLTRELSLLRAQTASVASTASSASTNVNESGDCNSTVASPRSTSRHRSSSTLSSRSVAGGTTYVPGSTVAALTSIIPPREGGTPSSSRQSLDIQRPSLSRETSASSPRQPEISSPPSLQNREDNSHRSSLAQPLSAREHRRSESASSASGTLRYEEAARHRAELEVVKRENESLRRRVRELEKILRDHRHV